MSVGPHYGGRGRVFCVVRSKGPLVGSLGLCALTRLSPLFFSSLPVIGRGGEQINKIQQDSGCKVQISPGMAFHLKLPGTSVELALLGGCFPHMHTALPLTMTGATVPGALLYFIF